jgi:hypothetical protein
MTRAPARGFLLFALAIAALSCVSITIGRDPVYKGRAVEATPAAGGFHVIGTKGQSYTVVEFDEPMVADHYYRIYRAKNGHRAESYKPDEHEKETGKIVSIGTDAGRPVVEMESGRKYRIAGKEAGAVGQVVHIVEIEDEYFVR